MKKINRSAISLVLTFSIILMTVSTVFASSSSTASTDWANPTASANGNAEFTAAVLTDSELPGIINDDATMILPAGFTGQKQIGGNALEISGLASVKDTVSISFAFPTYVYGWTGGIYKWDGSQWTAVESTLVAPTSGDSTLYHVTASKVDNGIYALLVAYK